MVDAISDPKLRAKLKAKLPPPTSDCMHCKTCPLIHVCCPDLSFRATMRWFNDDQLAHDIEKQEAGKVMLSGLNSIKRDVKKRIEVLFDGLPPEVEHLAINNRVVSRKTVNRKAYSVDAGSYTQYDFK